MVLHCSLHWVAIRCAVLVGIGLCLAILYKVSPLQSSFLPKCPFKLITGLNCPGCGFQRAVHSLLHGNVIQAFHYNWFLVYAGPYALLFLVEWFLPNSEWKADLDRVIENKYVVDFYIVSYVIWLIVRNILNI